MTPFQDDIARIIRTFSHWERVRFAQIGGKLPVLADCAPEPEWVQPSQAIPFVKKRRSLPKPPDESRLIRVRLDGAGSYTVREAAFLLNVGITHLRQKVRHMESVVRGVKVTRLTPERARKPVVLAAGSAKPSRHQKGRAA